MIISGILEKSVVVGKQVDLVWTIVAGDNCCSLVLLEKFHGFLPNWQLIGTIAPTYLRFENMHHVTTSTSQRFSRTNLCKCAEHFEPLALYLTSGLTSFKITNKLFFFAFP